MFLARRKRKVFLKDYLDYDRENSDGRSNKSIRIIKMEYRALVDVYCYHNVFRSHNHCNSEPSPMLHKKTKERGKRERLKL